MDETTTAKVESTNVLFVITPWKRRWELGNGGGLADDFHFIRGFTSNGWRVRYVSPRDVDPPDVSLDGYAVHGFFNIFETTASWPVWSRRLVCPIAFTMLATYRALQLARRERPRVVLGQSHLSALAVFLVGMVCGVPSVVKLFGVEELSVPGMPRARRLRRNAELMAALKLPVDLWIVLDDGTRGDEALRDRGVPPERIRFLPNGVDLAWASRATEGASFRRALSVPGDARVLLWLARHVAWKRGDAAIRSLARARAADERLVLVIGGDGPERPALERLARELGVGGAVHFAGPIAHERVPDAMAASDVFLATAERSNQSVATCEALLCGVPVVAFDVGRTGYVVRDGETGRLVPDADDDALADALVDLVRNDALRGELAANARRFALSHFTDWSRRVEMERDILERLS